LHLIVLPSFWGIFVCAILAAESLGLGTCLLAGIHLFIQNGRKAKRFHEKHGIKYKSKEDLFLILRYPAVNYWKGIRRSFVSVTAL